MSVGAVLSVDDGATMHEGTTFNVKPEIGEIIKFWHNGREPRSARVTELEHFQTEDGFVLVVKAATVIEP